MELKRRSLRISFLFFLLAFSPSSSDYNFFKIFLPAWTEYVKPILPGFVENLLKNPEEEMTCQIGFFYVG
jgi:hypothetical protein